MKVFLKIVGTVVVIIALLLGSVSVKRNLDDARKKGVDAEKIAAFQAQIDSLKQVNASLTGASKEALSADIEKAEEELGNATTASTFKTVAYLLMLLCALSFISGILLYLPKPKAIKIILALVVVVSLAAIVLSPNPKQGMTSGLPNRTIAMITAAFTLIGILIPFVLARKKQQSA